MKGPWVAHVRTLEAYFLQRKKSATRAKNLVTDQSYT